MLGFAGGVWAGGVCLDGAGCTGACCEAGAGVVCAGGDVVGACEAGASGSAGFCAGAGLVPMRSKIEPKPPRCFDWRRTIVIEVTMNMMAHQVVALERNVAAPRGPNAVWLPAPPNAPARSAALPLCSNTTMTSMKQIKIWAMTKIG